MNPEPEYRIGWRLAAIAAWVLLMIWLGIQLHNLARGLQ